MARLVIDTEGRRRIYELLDDQVRVGAGQGSQVRLPALRAEHHLVLTRRGGVYCAAALPPGAAFGVNGATATEHTLRHGDRIEIGGAVLLFLDEETAAAGTAPAGAPSRSPSAPAGGLGDLADAAARDLGARARLAGRPERAARARREPPARRPHRARRDPRRVAMISTLVCLGSASAYYLIRASSSVGFGESAESLLRLAEHQAQAGHADRAIASLESALLRQPDESTRREVEALLGSLRATLALRADPVALQNAAVAFRNLEEFERAFLTADPNHRPACRELVRKVDDWLESFGEPCRGAELEAAMVASAEAMRARYLPAARLAEPDTAEDVVFQAHYRVRVKGRRRYRDAAALLDAFLARVPAGAEDAAEVRRVRADLVAEGTGWAKRQLRSVERLIEAGELEDARGELDFLSEQALPEWQASIDEARRGLERMGR